VPRRYDLVSERRAEEHGRRARAAQPAQRGGWRHVVDVKVLAVTDQRAQHLRREGPVRAAWISVRSESIPFEDFSSFGESVPSVLGEREGRGGAHLHREGGEAREGPEAEAARAVLLACLAEREEGRVRHHRVDRCAVLRDEQRGRRAHRPPPHPDARDRRLREEERHHAARGGGEEGAPHSCALR
jgi:hypothetical protein